MKPSLFDFGFQKPLAPLSMIWLFLFFIVVISGTHSSPTSMLAQTAFPISGVKVDDGEGEALPSLPDFWRSTCGESDVELGILPSCEEIFN